MAILITGGCGYIGSHTCVEMLQAGYDIVVVDNYYNSKPEALKRVKESKSSGRLFSGMVNSTVVLIGLTSRTMVWPDCTRS